MTMPGRNYSSNLYRYGFNGKENDKDISESVQDYGMRIYDVRIAKFFSVDPITADYPELTPYQFSSNTPIWAIDMDGLEAYYTSPTQVFYQGCADITEGLANAWDKFTGFFVSHKVEVEIEKSKSTSILTTKETTVDVGGNMQSYIRAGRYSSSNTMPKLKLSDVYDIKVKSETKVELKKKAEGGNVKVESKINLVDGST
jgi:RHS repeat-associated protein